MRSVDIDPSIHDQTAARRSPLSHQSNGAYEIVAALRNYYVALVFGWQDVAQRYRRSKVGAFWITISVGVMIATLSFLFGALFRLPLQQFLPYVAIGLIVWNFIASVVNEGCTTFIESAGMILQVRLPLFTHIMRVVWRNLIIFGHNLVIVPLVLLGVQLTPTLTSLLAVPGFAILLLNVSWIALILAILCARYRDITQAIQNLMQIAFFLTPIFWMPHSISERVPRAFLEFNPFFHLISLVREPLLGRPPSVSNWLISIGFALLGWTVAVMFLRRYGKRVPYWL